MPEDAKRRQSLLERLALHGNNTGRVKLLSGFQKKVHREPDAVNDATQGFLARICSSELEEEAEQLFQDTRSALGYKRRDISLTVSSPIALLTTRDLSFELAFSLCDDDPTLYSVSRKLHQIRSADLLRTDELNSVFAGMFSSMVFGLSKSVAVESVIDAIEDLDGDQGLEVTYPSDCRECTVTVKDIPVQIVLNGAAMELVFATDGSPRELLGAFEEVQSAFSTTESAALAALV